MTEKFSRQDIQPWLAYLRNPACLKMKRKSETKFLRRAFLQSLGGIFRLRRLSLRQRMQIAKLYHITHICDIYYVFKDKRSHIYMYVIFYICDIYFLFKGKRSHIYVCVIFYMQWYIFFIQRQKITHICDICIVYLKIKFKINAGWNSNFIWDI